MRRPARNGEATREQWPPRFESSTSAGRLDSAPLIAQARSRPTPDDEPQPSPDDLWFELLRKLWR